MSKFLVFIFVLFITLLALFAIYNQSPTTITIPFGSAYETPTIALVLFSIAIGGLSMLFIFVIRDTKRYVHNLQHQKKQKREAKVQELYAKGLHHMFAHHNIREARELFKAVLVEDPDHLNALLQIGNLELSEDDFQAAREYYERALESNPKNVDVLFSLVKLMEKTDRLPQALKYLEDILEIDEKDLSALYKKREILERLEKWDEVVFVQKTILKNEHREKDKNRERLNLVGYKYEYGRHSLENGDFEKAKKAFRTVLRLERDYVPATLGLAEVLLREGENEEAINLLEKNYEQTSSMIVLLRLEDLLISVGEPLRLIRIYKNNILRNPQDPVIKFFLGRLYNRLEMIDDAFEIMMSIDTGGAVYPQMHQLLGDIYIKRNQIDKAVHEYKKALESNAQAFKLSYRCVECGHTSPEWSGRCSGCRNWNTFQMNLVP